MCSHRRISMSQFVTLLQTSLRSRVILFQSLVWQEVTHDSKIRLPRGFTIERVTTYLSSFAVTLDGGGGERDDEGLELVEAGTEKPIVKGRRMYASERLTLVEFASGSSTSFFRSNCEASLRKENRYPAVAIDAAGVVIQCKCTCAAAADQRCCHIACLLFLVEDLSLSQPPKIQMACTSKPQSWGRGSLRQLDPGPIYQKR
jgi:hypothetical protein